MKSEVKEILSESGIAIFMFGNKVIADGCLQEFEISKEKGYAVIPIGSTGDATQKIFEEVKKEKEKYSYLTDFFDNLEYEHDVDKIVKTVISIIECLKV